MTSVWYADSGAAQPALKRKRGRPRKDTTTMAPNGSEATTANETAAAPAASPTLVQRTVFDLAAFDDILLKKEVTLPTRPTSVEEALAAVNNDTAELLSVIYDGLVERTREAAREEISGFRLVNEDGTLGEAYNGKYASEEQGKLINGAVLNLAKMLGYAKSLPAEKKAALKAEAITFLRSNPAMLKSIQGTGSSAEPEPTPTA